MPLSSAFLPEDVRWDNKKLPCIVVREWDESRMRLPHRVVETRACLFEDYDERLTSIERTPAEDWVVLFLEG